MHCFQGKRAVVTGGASGIGRGLVEELCRAGATVVIADLNLDGAEQLAASLRDEGCSAHARSLDVTQVEQVQGLIDWVRGELGDLDYYVNNAGIAAMGEVRDTPMEKIRQLVDVNLLGLIYGSKLAYEAMVEQGHGHIVNVASVTGLYTYPVLGTYSATKWAAIGFSTALRAEGHGLGVRVSTVCPQNIRSNMARDGIPCFGTEDPEFFKGLPARWTDANVAAQEMLRGVARNQAIIVVPKQARTMWFLSRISPGLARQFGRSAVWMFRRYGRAGSPHARERAEKRRGSQQVEATR